MLASGIHTTSLHIFVLPLPVLCSGARSRRALAACFTRGDVILTGLTPISGAL